MANLKAGTLIGGNLIWNAGNMPLRLSNRNLFVNDDEIYTTYKKPTPADVGAVNKAGDTMTGDLNVNASIRSKTSNSYWMSDGSIGTFWRKDGTDLYLMRTLDGKPASSGEWSAHRPFVMNLATCKVSIGNGLYVKGGLELGDQLVLNSVYLKGANNGVVFRDHGNGNVTLSGGINSAGTAGDLYLGYNASASGTAGYNTRSVRLESGMNWKGGVVIVDGTGKINSENMTGPIRTEKDASNVYHTIIGGADTVNRGRTIIAAGEAGRHIADNTSSGQEVVHIGGDDNTAIWLHTGLQNGWDGSTHKKVKIDQGELYAVDGTKKVFHADHKPFKVHHVGKPSGLVDGRYYPILITGATNNQELYISTRQSGGADPMNNCSFAGQIRAMGWSDGKSYVDGMFTVYSTEERAIHSIWDHTENTGIYAIYVEARAFPIVLRVDSSCSVSCTGKDMPSDAGGVFPANLTSAQLDSGSIGGAKNRVARNFNRGMGYYRMDNFVSNMANTLISATNFDTLDFGGTFNLYNTNTTGSINPPPVEFGTLLVVGTSRFANTFVTQYATDKQSRKTYIRTRNDGAMAWTSWVQIYDSANKPTPADVGAVNKAGDTMTGKLTATGFNSSTGANAYTTGKTSDGSYASISAESSYVMLWKRNDSATIADEFIGIKSSELIFRQDNKTGDKKYTDRKVYHTGFKPTPADIGALPISGGNLTGLLYAKTAVIAESPNGKNWVALESTDSAKPYISVKHDGTSRKVIDFNSPTESTFLTGVATQQNFTCVKGSAGGFYLNNTSDGSKYKWGVLKGNANEFSISNWKDDGGWNKNVIEINKDATETIVNATLSVKNTVMNIGYADNTNLHLWFRRANGAERSLLWSDEDYLRMRHKEGSWLGIKQNGSIHTSANPPSMNEGVYNGTTAGGTWRRGQGVYHAKVAHQGSSWAPMFSSYFHDTEGYDGFYTLGHLSSPGAGVGHYCLHFIDGAGNAGKFWSFNGSSGDFVSPGNVVAYSDSRVKTNVETITGALDKIGEIRGVTYDRTDITTDRQMGVIAQEVQKVCPEVVHTVNRGAAGDILGVSYGNLVGLLIEGIKELRSELDELRTQMNK